MPKGLFVLLVCANGYWARGEDIQDARAKLQAGCPAVRHRELRHARGNSGSFNPPPCAKPRRGEKTLVYVSDDPNAGIEGMNTVYKAECFCTFIGTI